jgi:hypothetical protein
MQVPVLICPRIRENLVIELGQRRPLKFAKIDFIVRKWEATWNGVGRIKTLILIQQGIFKWRVVVGFV